MLPGCLAAAQIFLCLQKAGSNSSANLSLHILHMDTVTNITVADWNFYEAAQ